MNKKIKLALTCSAVFSSLSAQSVDLGTIVVTSATKSEQSIQDVTSNIDVITSEEIEEKNYTTVTEALNSLSGINYTSNGGLGKSTSVMVRGFDSKRVLVLIDGVRYNDITGLSGAPFEHLMIDDIKQIEVVKGAQSGIWGADASAGVINIITKGAKKGLHGFINGEYGSFKSAKVGIGASYKTDNYYVKASSKRVQTDGFSAQAPRGDDIDMYEKDGYENTTSNIKFGFNINETNKIDITHTIIDAENDYDGFNDPDAKKTSTTNDTFSKINFHHIDSFNKVDIYAKKSLFDREYIESASEYDGEVYEYGLKSNISYADNDFVLWGFDYKSYEHKNDLNETYSNKAFFLTNSNKFENTIITESIRYDEYDKFDNKVTGKIGIKQNYINDFTISANIGSSYNVPTIYNLYGPYGNLDLKPENTTSYDISIEYKAIQLIYFYNEIQDMIDWSTLYINIDGTSKLQGLELKYNTNIFEDLSLVTNYTYLDAKNSDDEVLKRRAKNTIKASLDYYGKSLHVGVAGEYIGERYNDDNKQGQQTGKYALFNAVANYNISKNYQIYLKVDNITDKYYQVVDGYATAERSGYIGFKAKY